MNAPMTREQLDRFAVHSSDLLSELVPNVPRHSKGHGAPFSKRQDGRKRRKARAMVRRSKSAWLYS